MKTHSSFHPLTLAQAFEQSLNTSSFARRTRESYTEDLAPLFIQASLQPVTALTTDLLQTFLLRQESLAPATYNRRLAALRSYTQWLRDQGWVAETLLEGVKRKPERKRTPRALDAQQVETLLRKIEDPRDRALFWLIYDGGLRGQEALAIDIDDICWPERSIRIHSKGDRPREIFFSCAVGTLLDKYLAMRGYPTSGPLFVTHRKARLPRRGDLDADGYARLSYRQADTLWKGYTPDWDLHQLLYWLLGSSVRKIGTSRTVYLSFTACKYRKVRVKSVVVTLFSRSHDDNLK